MGFLVLSWTISIVSSCQREKITQGLVRLTIARRMFTSRTAHSQLSKSVDQVISFLLNRFTLVIFRSTCSAVLAAELTSPRLLHATSAGVDKGNRCRREHQLAGGRMEYERDDHAGDEWHDKIKQPGSKVDSGKPGRTFLLAPGPKTGNVLDEGENADNDGSIETLDVSAHLVGRELFLFRRVEVQATGHGSVDGLGVDDLLLKC